MKKERTLADLSYLKMVQRETLPFVDFGLIEIFKKRTMTLREGRNDDILSEAGQGGRERKGLDLLSSIRLKKSRRHSLRFIC